MEMAKTPEFIYLADNGEWGIEKLRLEIIS